MRFISINNVKEGMVLSKPICNEQNKPLLREGATLSTNLIEKLKSMNYKGLYIEDELTKDIVVEDMISNETKDYTLNSLRRMDVENTVKSAEMIVDDLCAKKNISFDMLNTGAASSNNIYHHSLNVCEFAVAIGRSLGYDKSKLVDLAVSALLHDIGKICVDKNNKIKVNVSEALKKQCNISGNMDEYEEKMHPVYGYNLIVNNPEIKATTKQGVLFHHEDEDGKSLLCQAMNISSSRIYPYAKIIHICDYYDHLLTGDILGKMISPSDAYEVLNAGCGTKFNTELVGVFQRNIPAYPIGVTVTLSNGLTGVVYENNKNLPLRPKIKLETGQKVDLSVVMNVTITGIQMYEDEKQNIL